MELTVEQKRALAVASARQRAAEAEAATPPASPTPAVPAGAPPGSALNAGLAKGMTFGFGDELFAAGMAPIEAGIAAFKGEDADKGVIGRLAAGYDRALAKNRNMDKALEAESPIASTVGEIGGALMTGGALSKGGISLLSGAKPTIGSMAGRGAAEGAAYGALSGFGGGEGTENRLENAAKGGLVGGALGGTIGAIAGRGAARSAESAVPSNDQLKTAAQSAYQRADDAGVIVTPQGMQRMAGEIKGDLTEFGYLPKLQPRIAAVVDELDRVAGGNNTLKGIDTLRRVASNARMSADPSEQELGRRIIQRIDGLIDDLRPGEIMSGDAPAAADALKEARSLWSRMRKSEMLDDALGRADLRAASTGSGGNVDNATRQNVRAILDSPKRSAGMSDAELAALETIVRGTPTQNAMRLVGKLAPQGNGLMLALNAGAAGATGGLSLAGTAAGSAAKALADRGTTRAAEVASALIRNGGEMPAAHLSPQMRAIVEALVRGGAIEGPKAISTTR